MTEYTLILVRHGESQWNEKNLFTGWVDVDLNEKGLGEAKRAGELLKAKGVLPDVLHTSLLRRAIHTAQLALDECDRHWIPVKRTWRLNERHYGALQGKDKKQTLEIYGEEQFKLWRRSYDVPPPAGESLKDTVARVLPYYCQTILPQVLNGKHVLVAAHGNSLRALVMVLDGLSPQTIPSMELETGIPLIYRLNADSTVASKLVSHPS